MRVACGLPFWVALVRCARSGRRFLFVRQKADRRESCSEYEPEADACKARHSIAPQSIGFGPAGAEMCVFGDIDIEDHAAWCRERCKNAGIRAGFPLWQRNRRENTEEAVNLGYKCLVKCINNKLLPREYLGREIDCSMIDDMEKRGIDICGENGEYHTIVLDGPIFKKPVEYTVGDKLDFGDISVVDIH